MRVHPVSWISTSIAWLKDAIRGVQLDPHWQPPEVAAEVDSERQRYTAARYVEQQRSAMDGDHTGRREWARFIRSLSDEDYGMFFAEVDELIEAGGLVAVLTDEQKAEARERVLARKDEIQADNARLMKDWGVAPEYMHDALSVTHATGDGAFQLEPIPNPRVDDCLDEDGLPAWPADLGSEAWDERDGMAYRPEWDEREESV